MISPVSGVESCVDTCPTTVSCRRGVEAAGRGLAVPHIKITAVPRLAPPFLAFKRRDVRREVRGVVQKIDAERAVLHSQAGDGGIITIRHIPAAEQPLLKCAEHGAVREDGNRFAGIRGGNVAQRRLKTRGKLLPRLTAPRRASGRYRG